MTALGAGPASHGSEISLPAAAQRLAHLLGVRPELRVEQGTPGDFLYGACAPFLGQFRWLPPPVKPPVTFADRYPPGVMHARAFLKLTIHAGGAGYRPAHLACQVMSFRLIILERHGLPRIPWPQPTLIFNTGIAASANS